MKKLFCSIVGTVVVAAFLVVASPMYARGGHGGHRGGHGGHAVRHAAAGHVKGGHGAFRVRGGRGHNFARHARGLGDIQDAHMLGIAVAPGEVIMDIRTMEIPGTV